MLVVLEAREDHADVGVGARRQAQEIVKRRREDPAREVLLRDRELAAVPPIADLAERGDEDAIEDDRRRPQKGELARLVRERAVVVPDDRVEDRPHAHRPRVALRRRRSSLYRGAVERALRRIGSGDSALGEAPHFADLCDLPRPVEPITGRRALGGGDAVAALPRAERRCRDAGELAHRVDAERPFAHTRGRVVRRRRRAHRGRRRAFHLP